MGAFLYGTALQWRLDIRSRTAAHYLLWCRFLFFAMMGGIFLHIVNPSGKNAGSVHDGDGCLHGGADRLPPSLVEITAAISKMYKANGAAVLRSHPGALVHISASDADERGDLFGCAACIRRGGSPTRQRISGALAVFAASLSVGGVLGQ